MIKAIIPYEPYSLVQREKNAVVHKSRLENARESVLSELRSVPAVRTAVTSLDQDVVYKLILSPEGATLKKDAAGNIAGVFYKDGKIVKHAKFQAVKPSLVKAAATAGSQVLLISIAMQLSRVEQGISELKRELHNDRLAEIEAGISLFHQAVKMKNLSARDLAIMNAVQGLNAGIQKTMRSLKDQIKALPDADVGFFDNWGRKKTTIAAEAFSPAEDSFHQCLEGMQVLAECYAFMNEPQVAADALENYLKKLAGCNLDVAAEKARLLPANNKRFPEKLWGDFLENQALLFERINDCRALSNQEMTSIEIELKPSELMEVCDEDV